MKYTEQTALFTCKGDRLIGILVTPETPPTIGVIVIVGGPQYRVGSHRQFVLLSRALATAGYAVLRFDYRGMGDSEGQQRDFQAVSEDIAIAIDVMQKHLPSIKNIALWGLCDGASAALLYCYETHDSRVSGLCLLNPWIRSEISLARTQMKHYYAQRLMQKEFWNKLFSGGVASSALTGLMHTVRVAVTDSKESEASHRSVSTLPPFQQRMAEAWNAFAGRISLLMSGNDYTAKEFLEYAAKDAAWTAALTHPRLIRHDLQGADHTCSSGVSHALLTKKTLIWLGDQD